MLSAPGTSLCLRLLRSPGRCTLLPVGRCPPAPLRRLTLCVSFLSLSVRRRRLFRYTLRGLIRWWVVLCLRRWLIACMSERTLSRTWSPSVPACSTSPGSDSSHRFASHSRARARSARGQQPLRSYSVVCTLPPPLLFMFLTQLSVWEAF